MDEEEKEEEEGRPDNKKTDTLTIVRCNFGEPHYLKEPCLSCLTIVV